MKLHLFYHVLPNKKYKWIIRYNFYSKKRINLHKLLSLLFAVSLSFADMIHINSFEANFTQTIVNDKNNTLTYQGHVLARKPQLALWQYTKPVEKSIYITHTQAVIIEPEIEQVYIQNIKSSFDFFNVIKNAKKVSSNTYIAEFQETKYTITIKENRLISISYLDELENRVLIVFSKQVQNKPIDKKIFTPNIPLDYDIIRG